ncbi:MAG: GGDEF domain-containing protein [Gammaproteobacteria bacterium]|nr:GGDEF domain-containing protein [Gammaproteobacteria bacterium]
MDHPTAPQAERGGGALHRVLRTVALVDGLLLLLTAGWFVVASGTMSHPRLYLAALAAYGGIVIALRLTGAFDDHPREKLVGAAAAMVFFISAVLAFDGGDHAALLNLYLLPIVTAALTLGRGPTVLVVGMVLAGRVGLSHFVAGVDVLAPGYGLGLMAEAVPVLLVALLTSTLAADIQDANDRLQAMSDHDGLTGLLNLQAFTQLLNDERERAGRRGNPFAVLLVDVEGLKGINDRFGHEAGNRALVAVAQALVRSCRSVDLAARYGGDEFVVFVSGAGAAIARAVANRIRHNVATTTLQFGGNLHRIGVGIGAGVFPADGRQLRDLMNAATRALDKDKESRRPLARSEAALRASPTRAVGP